MYIGVVSTKSKNRSSSRCTRIGTPNWVGKYSGTDMADTDSDKINMFIVALQISDLVKNKEPPTFSELVKILDGRVSRNEISKAIDQLSDIGLLKEKSIKRERAFRRELYLTKEADPLIEKIMAMAVKTETFTDEQRINWTHQLTAEQEQTILSWKPMTPYLQGLVCESKIQKEAVALLGHPLPQALRLGIPFQSS